MDIFFLKTLFFIFYSDIHTGHQKISGIGIFTENVNIFNPIWPYFLRIFFYCNNYDINIFINNSLTYKKIPEGLGLYTVLFTKKKWSDQYLLTKVIYILVIKENLPKLSRT